MRRLAACMGALLLVSPPLLTGCDDYDDSELWQNVNDLKSRIEALETKIGQMNTEIAALQKIVDDAVTVVKVEKSADGMSSIFRTTRRPRSRTARPEPTHPLSASSRIRTRSTIGRSRPTAKPSG